MGGYGRSKCRLIDHAADVIAEQMMRLPVTRNRTREPAIIGDCGVYPVPEGCGRGHAPMLS
jgi:hypothetical protein